MEGDQMRNCPGPGRSKDHERRRLQVDLAMLRESFKNGDIGAVKWAETTAQFADDMMKADDTADSTHAASLE
jgi:DNA-binding transcriptional regulator LsrR (DeoR family)